MLKKPAFWIGVGALLLLAAACAWGARSIYCLQGRCPKTESREDKIAGVRVTLWSQRSRYREGETIHIRATIENISDQTIILKGIRDEPAFDIQYEYGDLGSETHLWSELHPDLATNQLELDPGEKFEAELKYMPEQADSYHFKAYVWTRQGTSRFSLTLSIGYALLLK